MNIRSSWLFSLIITTFLGVPAQAQQAPEFTLVDADGNQVSLADYRGKALILHFWATWCPYCERLQPGLESLYQDFQADGLEVLGINFLDKADAEPQKVLRERGLTFKTAIDGDEVASLYGVQGTPTTFFITRDGAVLWVTNNSDPNDPRFEDAVDFVVDALIRPPA